MASERRADLLVCVGGGSATGLAKAVALHTNVPIVAVPTTYAGSEATNVWGITEAARKTTGVDDRVLPVAVVYDPNLTLSMPIQLSIASGLNALAHSIDAMWAPRASPVSAALATEGIRALAAALPSIKRTPDGLPGREQALYGAYLAATAFASAGTGLHHRICHVLGGAYGLPHAETHAVMLPYVLAFNASAAPAAETRIAAAFDRPSAVRGLAELREALGAPTSLRQCGFSSDRIAEAAELILPAVPAGNPRTVTVADLRDLLRLAYEGADPGRPRTDREHRNA